jgi:UPF0755 protein
VKKIIFFLIAILIIASLYFVGKEYIEIQIFKPYGIKGESVLVEIKPGMKVRDLASFLQKKKIVRGRILFLLGYNMFFKGKTIKAGEYKFELPISLFDVLKKITKGEIYLHEITIPEGSTIDDIGKILEREGILKADDFVRASKNVELVSHFTDKANDLEGFLFPDTYFVPKGIPPEKILKIMVNRFKEKVGGYLDKVKEGLDFYSVLILASLIEKETGVDSEKPLVSSVFYNRLKRGMPLQCDPTVIYALKKEGKYQNILRKEELSFPSPYNTYLHKGLPPGPICNPGIASIESAINPARTDYLYFVSNGDGTHTFSSDLNSHNRAVRNYIRKIRESKKENSIFYR